MTEAMFKALQHFKGNNLAISEANIDLSDCYNIGVSLFLEMEDVPDLIGYRKKEKERSSCALEIAKTFIGKSEYTFSGLSKLIYTRLQKLFKVFLY